MPARKSDSGDTGKFTLVVATCFPGKRYVQTVGIVLNSRALAYEQCDQMQAAFDEDCEPRRAYILDTEGIPIRAGLARSLPADYFMAKHDRPARRRA